MRSSLPRDPDTRVARLRAGLATRQDRVEAEEDRIAEFARQQLISIERGEELEAAFLLDYVLTMRVDVIKLRAEIAAMAAEILQIWPE